MVKAAFVHELATKGVESFKGWAKALEDVPGYIMKSMERGRKSPFHISTEYYNLGHYKQTFKTKEGNIIQKMYNPTNGTIETALFKGDKARIIEQAPQYTEFTQPDHLVSSCWRKSSNPKLGRRHVLEITKPIEPTNSYYIEKSVHRPQVTTRLKVNEKSGYYDTYQSRMMGGRWYGYGMTGGPTSI